jgi:arylsulfatase A-like enzyme
VLSALSRWLPRSLVGFLVLTAAVLAWREGGGADKRVLPPRPDAAPVATEAPDHAHGAEAYEVTARLTDRLAEARIDVPSLGAAQTYLQPYWRKMRIPWTRLQGISAQLAMTLSMRISRDFEAQWAVLVPGGTTWIPEARVWNMNEGSFDQREAIFAPAPATLSFPLDLPQHARLRTSPAVLAAMPSTTVFEVTLVDAMGAEHTVSQTRIPGGDAKRWLDVDADLAAWGGQKVTLRLQTSSDKPGAFEKQWIPPHSDDPDAGPGEAPLIPAMALALWGDPVVVAKQPTRVPYDVLWIVVDALRPDVAASMHDAAEDAAELASPRPPLEARLPAIPGLMPGIDHLAARGVRFTHAWSAGAWTRPGTLAMLTGERSSELGIDTREWILTTEAVSHYYATEPPLLPLILRKNGVETAAFVNNFFMAGFVTVGLDMGFERVTDHRYRARDTAEITKDALHWLDDHASSRFFLFVNYNSPHEPYDPPKEMVARIPPPPAGPRDRHVRDYMAEGAKDDAAIATLLDKVDALGISKSTIVVVTSDHGETLSSAHGGYAPKHMPVRFHHAVGNFEETTRVPIVMALPGQLDGGRAVTERVRNVDLAPTILEAHGGARERRAGRRALRSHRRSRREAQRGAVAPRRDGRDEGPADRGAGQRAHGGRAAHRGWPAAGRARPLRRGGARAPRDGDAHGGRRQARGERVRGRGGRRARGDPRGRAARGLRAGHGGERPRGLRSPRRPGRRALGVAALPRRRAVAAPGDLQRTLRSARGGRQRRHRERRGAHRGVLPGAAGHRSGAGPRRLRHAGQAGGRGGGHADRRRGRRGGDAANAPAVGVRARESLTRRESALGRVITRHRLPKVV